MIISRFRNVLKGKKPFDFLVYLIWASSILLDYFRAVLLRIAPASTADLIITLLFVFLTILSIKTIIKRIKRSDCALYLIPAIFFGMSILLVSNNEYLSKYADVFLLRCLPLIIVGIAIDFKTIKNELYIISIISIYAYLVYRFLFGGGMDLSNDWYQEEMVSAYNILPHLLLIILFLFEKPSVINITTALIGSVLLFSLGSRGPAFALLLFIFAYLLFIKKWKKPIKSKLVIVFSVVFILLLSKPILELLKYISEKNGMSVRIFTRLAEGSIFDSSGRDELQDIVKDAIFKKPFVGYGFVYDRVLLSGTYTHNIFLELFLTFGIPVGVLMLVFLTQLLLRAILYGSTNFDKGFVLVLICCGLIKLLFSGSFVDEPYFYLLLGFSISAIRSRRSKRQTILKTIQSQDCLRIDSFVDA